MKRTRSHRVRRSERTLNDLLGMPDQSILRSGLRRELEDARTKPLGELTPGELHLLLRGGVAPQILLPFAAAALKLDPWRVVGYESGGLLAAIVEVDPGHWPPGEPWRAQLGRLLERALASVDTLYDFERNKGLESRITALLARVRSSVPSGAA